jgi:hypothetical protein
VSIDSACTAGDHLPMPGERFGFGGSIRRTAITCAVLAVGFVLGALALGSGVPSASAASRPTPAAVASSVPVPTGTLAYSLPELVVAHKRFSIAMSYTSSATGVTMYLDLKPLPAHGPVCGTTHAADRGAVATLSAMVAGVRTSTPMTLTTPGVWVACAWLEWPHGTIDGPFPGRFVVARRDQRPTLYYGVTSQRLPRSKLKSSYPIAFQAIDGQIVNLAYFARYRCTRPGSPPSHPIYSTSFPAFGLRSPTGFGFTFAQGSDRAVISGQLTHRHAVGTLSEMYASGGYQCRSGAVTFTAQRA